MKQVDPYRGLHLHVVSHTHWDREWYQPFEVFRLRLTDLIDHLLDIFRKYPEYKEDPSKQILLSYCIQGTYHAYLSNPRTDTDTFVETVENIVRCLRPLL